MFKFVAILLVASLALVAAANGSTGGIEPLKGPELKEARKILVQTLNRVALLKGPVYKIEKINKATAQVVQGYIYRYNVDLSNRNSKTLTCKVEIWQFMSESTIRIFCPGKQVFKKKLH